MSTSDDARDPNDEARDADQDAPDDTTEATAAKAVATDKKSKKAKKAKKQSPFKRFALFLRQVVAELRKVIWPTRSELINYTVVVLIFVVIMALILSLYDFAFARLVFWIFGG